MLDSQDCIRVSESLLETVLPAVGGRVRVVKGPYRGNVGTLAEVDFDRFEAKVQMEHSARAFGYDEICKIAKK